MIPTNPNDAAMIVRGLQRLLRDLKDRAHQHSRADLSGLKPEVVAYLRQVYEGMKIEIEECERLIEEYKNV